MLVLPRLKDGNYYVQKAIEWTLREALQVYPAAVYAWLNDHGQELSALALTTVMEKVDHLHTTQYKIRRQRREC